MSTLKVDTIQDASGVSQFLTKAWVNFNGTGTVSIRDDGNVSSITDHTTGKYTVNTSTAMPSANFSANCDGCRQNSDIALIAGPVHFAFTTTSFRMRTLEYDASSADSLNTCVTITHQLNGNYNKRKSQWLVIE